MDVKSLAQQAFALPESDRAKLALALIESLEAPTAGGTERLWLEEVERRVAQVREGVVDLIDGDVVAAQARALLK